MRILIRKELVTLFCSSVGLFFSFIFLLTNGLILWFFEGSFNILDAGYASLEKFFSLSAILLLLLTPALTMRLIADEKRFRTLEMLRTRPLSISKIIFSKWFSTVVYITIVILSTITYIYTLSDLTLSSNSLDLGVIFLSYISLIILSSVFTAIGVFASSLTKNQIVAFVIALFSNFVIYFGFELISDIFVEGNSKIFVESCGLFYHLSEIQRGTISINNIWIFFNYTFFIFIFTIWILSFKNIRINKKYSICTLVLVVMNIVMIFISPYQLDLTSDKRYSISNFSIELVRNIKDANSPKVKIDVYLDGNLNQGFLRLKSSTKQLLKDLNRYADNKMQISFVDPTNLNISRDKLPEYMTQRNMTPIMLNEVDRDGKVGKQLIYPYAEVIVGQDTLQVQLLQNIKGNTAEENLNASISNLEFQFIDALRLLLKRESAEIAFIEGHGELPRPYVYDAEEALSKYFFVNRGEIGNNLTILDNFKVIIISGPIHSYSETEKYIIDQYIMKGGRVLWLVDGAYVSLDDLTNKGQSASMKNETGLDDLLFTYGIRIEPNLLQDFQSTKILLQAEGQSINIPWYFSPLLLPSLDDVITKDITEVKATFASSINLLSKSNSIKKKILLTTSQHSHIIAVPEMITFEVEDIQSDVAYFKESFLPVAVSLEGEFQSAFKNRLVPDSVFMKDYKTKDVSVYTKMIVVSSSDVIKNDIIGQGDDSEVLPMGYDRVLGRRYGNREFIVNAVNWLANDDGWMELRSKTQYLNLLDKRLIYENRIKYAVFNTVLPLLIVILILGGVTVWRKKKYSR